MKRLDRLLAMALLVTKPYGMKEVSFQDPDGYTWTLGEKVGA